MYSLEHNSILKLQAIHIKFTKSKEGAIIQVLVHNKDVWKKANDYKP